MNTVTYSGHTASESGVSTWPSRRVTRRWEHVAKIETGLSFDAKTYHARILFTVGKTLTLRGTKFAPSSMRRFAAFLARAIARAPATAEIDERTREIAQWGGAEMEARLRRLKGIAPSMAQWLEQARFLRARLEHGKALKAVARVLERQPSHVEALELRFQLLEESGARLPKLIAAAEQVLLHAPDDAAARTRVLGLKLQANDARIVPEVEQVLAREPDNFVLGFALAGYFFRAKDFDRAMAITDALAKRPGATAWQRGAAESRDYVQRYATSGTFRAKERLKYWGRVAAVFVPLALLVGGKVWSVYARQAREERTQRERQAVAQDFARRQQEISLEHEKTLGWAVGNFVQIKARADAGEAIAQFTLGEYLFEGNRGAPKDPVEGLRYLELAVGQNYPQALTSLAERYEEGRGVEADRARALVLLRQAVELGSPRAAELLGNRYLHGHGVEKDAARALTLFRKAAAGGSSWGEALVGWSLEAGEGSERDIPAALASYRRAAEKKDAWAQEQLVRLLSDPRQSFHDQEEAARWMEIGARQGSASLRVLYFVKMHHGGAQNVAQIVESKTWLAEAAKKGDAAALYFSGESLWWGWYEEPDLAKAARFYGQAADRGHLGALLKHAQNLAAGVGVEQDFAQARKLREKLAKMKTPEASLEKLDALIAVMERPLSEMSPEVDRRPRPILQTGPLYPWRMSQAGINGEVVVEFTIGLDGRTKQLRLVRSSHKEFEGAAMAAVAFWRFEPAIKAGRRSEVLVSQMLQFQLEDEAQANRAEGTPVEAAARPPSGEK